MATRDQTGSKKVSGENAMSVTNEWITGQCLELFISGVRRKDADARKSRA